MVRYARGLTCEVEDAEMPVRQGRNAGASQNKEQLNRSRLTLFIQQVEKEGPNLVKLTVMRSCCGSHGSEMFPHSSGAHERAGGQNGERVSNHRQGVQGGADEDASVAAELQDR